ncbi:hypothetical protein CRE_20947 [Caenorhabditis remanei]|uniref:Uncharacterized protein n=1 Tax=Caenorhabditis remanei TaxID=31234 RepID=E3NCR6_CAERE|nr:hypothetical protein CRE_20947 [Caenorhabditis remanei]
MKLYLCFQLGAVEVIPTYVSIMKNFGRDILRTEVEFEFSSSARLSVILKSLKRYEALLTNSRFYYCTYKPSRCSDLFPIALNDTNLRFYDIVNMKSPAPVLYLIVMGKDIHFIDSKS